MLKPAESRLEFIAAAVFSSTISPMVLVNALLRLFP